MSGNGRWGVFVPTLILVMMLIDLGAFIGTQGENKYGKDTQDVKYKADNKSSN
ncbi:Putative membrane protein [Escherichia coli ISC7]|uniref:Membrane protein n=1 Tax=Escherichia coli ISC7 TaxID=1432555 RepID=W1F1W0_ECOLX|nr:Putative membrane protein [Escherichia coli ISC7]